MAIDSKYEFIQVENCFGRLNDDECSGNDVRNQDKFHFNFNQRYLRPVRTGSCVLAI